MVDHVADGLLRIGEEVGAVSGAEEIAAFVRYCELLAGRCDKAQFGDSFAFFEGEGERNRHQGFDTRAVYLAVALSRVAVDAGEERAGNQYREEDARAGRQVTNVDVAAVFARGNGGKASRLAWGDSHHAAEWLVGNEDVGAKLAVAITDAVMMQVRLCKVVGEQG